MKEHTASHQPRPALVPSPQPGTDLAAAPESPDALLARAGRALLACQDRTSALATIARLPLPTFADTCLVDVAGEKGLLIRGAAAHADPAREIAWDLADDSARGPAQVFRSGDAEVVRELDEPLLAALTPDAVARERLRSDLGSYASVPLVARGRTVGVLTLVSRQPGRYGVREQQLARDLADRAALAVDNLLRHGETLRALEARDNFLAVVAHDLRGPLGVIELNASLLQKRLPAGELGRSLARYAEGVRRAVGRVDGLIADILDVVTIESGKLVVVRTPQDARALASEAAAAFRGAADERDVTLELAVEPGVTAVRGDHERLLQVLGILLANSVQHSPPGGVVRVRVEARGGEVAFSVEDSGPGIAEPRFSRLFEPYWHEGPRDRHGVGLGLFIARGIIAAHRGRIWAETQEGAGSTFHFALPAAESATDEPPEALAA